MNVILKHCPTFGVKYKNLLVVLSYFLFLIKLIVDSMIHALSPGLNFAIESPPSILGLSLHPLCYLLLL